MAISEEIDFDPHGLKHDGSRSPRSAHVNEPYVHREFPKVLHKVAGEDHLTATVEDEESFDKAIADGWSETRG